MKNVSSTQVSFKIPKSSKSTNKDAIKKQKNLFKENLNLKRKNKNVLTEPSKLKKLKTEKR